MNGTERLGWNQSGDTSSLQYRIYIDSNPPVRLEGSRCNDATPEAECSAPLPSLTDGMHTLAVAAVSPLGVESDRSAPLTVQKVSTRSVVSTLPWATASSAGLRVEAAPVAIAGVPFDVDVIARDVQGPVQLSLAADGRLLVADADGRVRLQPAGDALSREPALDAGALLRPAPIGPLSVAAHPDFARNHFVYVSYLSNEVPDLPRLHVVRLREAGGVLGEPAAIFEAPVASVGTEESRARIRASSRIAFGPDGLLHVLLAPGHRFVNEPAASRPDSSVLTLQDDGRPSADGPLSGVLSHPFALGWHPTSGDPWGVVTLGDGRAGVQPLAAAATGAQENERPILRIEDAGNARPGVLRWQGEVPPWAGAFAEAVLRGQSGTIRLGAPIQVGDGAQDGFVVHDVVAGQRAVYVVVEDVVSAESGGHGTASIVRLRPR